MKNLKKRERTHGTDHAKLPRPVAVDQLAKVSGADSGDIIIEP
jgi:hypothetical protein